MSQFKNVSEFATEIEGIIVQPDQIVTLDLSHPDTVEELQILLSAGEFITYVPDGGVEPLLPVVPQKVFTTPVLPSKLEANAIYYVVQPNGKFTTVVTNTEALPTTVKRRWVEQTDGGRAYIYYSATIDRGRHTLYPTYLHWASGYNQTNPSRDAHGVGVMEPAKLIAAQMDLRGLATEQTPYTVTMWKQKKSPTTNTVVNTKLFMKDYTLNGTVNTTIKWTEDDFAETLVEPDDTLFVVFRRTVAGPNRFAYVKQIKFEFEGVA